MKQPSKFKRWFLGLFGGVPKSDYDIIVEQRENFIGDTKINEARIKELERENELLKKQVAHDPMAPVRIVTENVKIKEIKKSRADRFAAVRTNRVLFARRGFDGNRAVCKNRATTV